MGGIGGLGPKLFGGGGGGPWNEFGPLVFLGSDDGGGGGGEGENVMLRDLGRA